MKGMRKRWKEGGREGGKEKEREGREDRTGHFHIPYNQPHLTLSNHLLDTHTHTHAHTHNQLCNASR